MQAQFKAGQVVYYNRRQTFIEVIFDDGTCTIKNPLWNWDDEALYVNLKEDYPVPFWLTVKLSELKVKK